MAKRKEQQFKEGMKILIGAKTSFRVNSTNGNSRGESKRLLDFLNRLDEFETKSRGVDLTFK